MNTITDNTSIRILYSSWAYIQLRGEAVTGNIVQDNVQQMLRVRAGRSYKYFWEFIFEQGRGEAPIGI